MGLSRRAERSDAASTAFHTTCDRRGGDVAPVIRLFGGPNPDNSSGSGAAK